MIVRSPPGATNDAVFYFPGGTVIEFIKAVEKDYQVDWLSIADIPDELRQVRVPKLRIPRTGRGPEWQGEVCHLVPLYNELTEQNPQLGKLVVLGAPWKPSAVMLVPRSASAGAQVQLKVKAFSLTAIHPSDWKRVERDIEEARNDALGYGNRSGNGGATALAIQGTVSIHKDTKLLVAVGTEGYLEMVESVVAAHRDSRNFFSDEPAPAPKK